MQVDLINVLLFHIKEILNDFLCAKTMQKESVIEINPHLDFAPINNAIIINNNAIHNFC